MVVLCAFAAFGQEGQTRPAEEVFKNIQVLKGMPASELRPAMMRFSRALGVKCDYCHVAREFDKDDKPAKATAREMIRMVREIDDAHFPQTRLVTCWTCHRGNAKPETAPHPPETAHR